MSYLWIDDRECFCDGLFLSFSLLFFHGGFFFGLQAGVAFNRWKGRRGKGLQETEMVVLIVRIRIGMGYWPATGFMSEGDGGFQQRCTALHNGIFFYFYFYFYFISHFLLLRLEEEGIGAWTS